MTAPARAVYTALFGGYEKLTEQPVQRSSDAAFICLTDDPSLTSETWDVRLVEPPIPGDVVRSCRALKIRGHAALDGFEETLWIDNSVLLLEDPVRLLEQWLADADIALPWHSYRSNLAAEFDAVALAGRDDPARIYEQLEVYSATSPEVLASEVLWTAILARRPGPRVDAVMETWLDHVLRFSRRDQLSIRYALQRHGVEPLVLDLDNRESPWHRWPVTSGRPHEREFEFESEALANAPSIAEVTRLHADIDELTRQYAEAVALRERELSEIQSSRVWQARTRWADRLRPARDRLRRLRSALGSRSS